MKLFKNKKTMTGIIASLVGLSVLMGGISLAWFTSAGSVANNDITMGRLNVQVTLDREVFELGYPGIDFVDNIAKVQSLGNLPTMVQIDLNAEVTIRSDANGNPLPQAEWRTVPAPANLFTISPQVEGATEIISLPGGGTVVNTLARPLGMWWGITSSGDWFNYTWGSYDGKMYLVIDEPAGMNRELRFAYTINTNGPAMTNEYQNAVVKLNIDWKATQLMPDEAVEDIFGLEFWDVDWLTNEIELNEDMIFFQGSVPFEEAITDRIASLPTSNYRKLLESFLN
jgi:hypothetical protein